EHHADVPPHRHRVDVLLVNVLALVADVPLEAEAAHQVVHAVDRAEHRALAAARRSDERGDRALPDPQARVAHRLKIAIVDGFQVDIDDRVVAVAVVRGRALPGDAGVRRAGGRRPRGDVVLGHDGTPYLFR